MHISRRKEKSIFTNAMKTTNNSSYMNLLHCAIHFIANFRKCFDFVCLLHDTFFIVILVMFVIVYFIFFFLHFSFLLDFVLKFLAFIWRYTRKEKWESNRTKKRNKNKRTEQNRRNNMFNSIFFGDRQKATLFEVSKTRFNFVTWRADTLFTLNWIH